jgi:hypothetical protein
MVLQCCSTGTGCCRFAVATLLTRGRRKPLDKVRVTDPCVHPICNCLEQQVVARALALWLISFKWMTLTFSLTVARQTGVRNPLLLEMGEASQSPSSDRVWIKWTRVRVVELYSAHLYVLDQYAEQDNCDLRFFTEWPVVWGRDG